MVDLKHIKEDGMRKGERGFTLIELVMVIVILAILAAVAIPTFISFQEDARVSAAKGIGGAIAGAANVLHSQYALKNTAYVLGTTGGPSTGILYNANIAGATVSGTPNTITVDGSTAVISISVDNNTAYTMVLTMGSTTQGPKVQYNF